ncbi:hypothetical protein NQ314_009701 [Rhamnusium bicolor]|uniref:PiggyBac transposable element-derived protein domain-containing protein n=1 Tax=Rhamnusium bicolor TaxID=1586634 RepID=A0AAV8XWU9_9CUCU|nr:hypothetical protein NQ314_009701 [Rhamnusium bicolor]
MASYEEQQEHLRRLTEEVPTDEEAQTEYDDQSDAGVLKANRLNLEELWKSDGSGVKMSRLTMSTKRFKFLLTCLRFDNKQTREERKKIDKLAPIREFFDLFLGKCKTGYSPSKNVTIDEKLEGFRGRCSLRQYIPSKPSKYGIKIFALSDTKMYYTMDLEVYVGQQPDGPYKVTNSPNCIVERLCEPIKDSGRNLTIDNWFTSVPLVEKLYKEYTLTVIGTIQKLEGVRYAVRNEIEKLVTIAENVPNSSA